jgi:elongation factor 3
VKNTNKQTKESIIIIIMSTAKLQTALDTKKVADAKAFVSAATAELAEGGDAATATCGAIKTGVSSKDVVALTASIAEDQALLAALLHAAADKKSSDLCAAAADALLTIAMSAHDCVVGKALVPAALEALDPKERWQTQVAAANVLAKLSECAPQVIASCLTDILPVVTTMVNDAKQEVADASRAALDKLCHTIDNRDVEPFIPAMVSATIDHEQTDECVQKLASTTFVQTVTAAPLALISPILLLGFRARTTATKRMSAVIVNNMSKLVEDPEDAAPFLPQLLPAVEKASEQVSDPEARAVCGKACEQLQSIEAKLKDASFKSRRAVFDVVKGEVTKHVGAHFDAELTDHYTTIACALVNAKCQDYDYEEAYKGFNAVKDVRALHEALEKIYGDVEEEEEDDDTADVLADCQFTLAYGSKVLLHNTKLKLKRGHKYALLGGNDSGKTSLMRAIANEQVEGFPPASELRTVFVEADIIGELSDLPCVDYILADPRIKAAGITEETVEKMLLNVGFGEMQNGARNLVTFLSGGWRMKLALARAMCLNADILLMDEPTNHLDVMNVKWVEEYLKSLTDVTAVLVSHDTGFVDRVCNNIISIESLKLKQFRGNLTEFVEKNPKAKSFFELKSSTGFVMRFPQPGFIEGVKSKGKPLMKMASCTYTYPVNSVPTVKDVTVQVSLASRVACVGPNGVGKSTMIKLLTGEVVPQEGTVWKHPNARVAYVAQHAFHHIEQHLDKTPNEYIRWRYQHGDDKEALVKDTMTLTEEEKEKCKQPVPIDLGKDDKGNPIKVKMQIEKLTGGRKQVKKEYEYEVQFVGRDYNSNKYVQATKLAKWGFEKHMKIVDEKVAARAGAMHTPLTTANVEKFLEDVGLDKEFGTHTRMAALSGGQKVKVVIAAAMWNCPHIVILDEPTNYLDRDSLGALAGAIQVYEGGVVMITHNNEFCSALCPETWLMEKHPEDGIARCNCKGDAEWMAKAAKADVTAAASLEEYTDALGNVVEVKKKVDKNSKEAKKKAKLRAKRRARGEEVTDTDDSEWDGFGEE